MLLTSQVQEGLPHPSTFQHPPIVRGPTFMRTISAAQSCATCFPRGSKPQLTHSLVLMALALYLYYGRHIPAHSCLEITEVLRDRGLCCYGKSCIHCLEDAREQGQQVLRFQRVKSLLFNVSDNAPPLCPPGWHCLLG